MLRPEKLTASVEFSVNGTEWTGLRYGDLLLSNSVENADWSSDPVCPWACWDCEQAWCAQVCLSRVVRTQDQLLFMRPYRKSASCDPGDNDVHHKLLPDSLLIPVGDWNRVARSIDALPGFESFPQITNHDVFHLWLQHRPGFAIESLHGGTFLDHFQANCLASHPLEVAPALQVLAEHQSALENEPIPLSGTLVEVTPDPQAFNTFYFDFETTPELIAFGVCEQNLLIDQRFILKSPA